MAIYVDNAKQQKNNAFNVSKNYNSDTLEKNMISKNFSATQLEMKKWNLVLDNTEWNDCVVSVSLVNSNPQPVDIVVAISDVDGKVELKNAIARILVQPVSSATIPNVPVELGRKLFVHPSSVHTTCSVNGIITDK